MRPFVAMRRTAALLLLLACAPPTPPPAPAPSSPPPLPVSTAAVHGSVFDSAGQPVPHAMLRVWSACNGAGEPVTRWSGASSSYEIAVDGECAVIEAAAGGATARRTFRPQGKRVAADITLPPPVPLTRAAADRIITLLREGIVTRDPAAVTELATYTGLGPEATSARLADTQRHLRTVTEVTFVEPYVYELKGHREPPVRAAITRDSLIRVAF